MTLDPRQPVIGELSAALKEHFRPQAEDGRRQADGARKSAEAARALALPGFTQGQKLVTEGEGLFRRQDYAAAAQKYLESRDAFERATRQEIEEAPRAVAARPSPSPSVYPVALVTPSPLAPHGPAGSDGVAYRGGRPAAAGRHRPPPPPTTLAPVPATTRSAGSEAEVRQVIVEYGRAMETRDLALYRTLKPSLSSEDEKRLREAFKASKTQSVGITVDSVQVEGNRATVRATRGVIKERPPDEGGAADVPARPGRRHLADPVGPPVSPPSRIGAPPIGEAGYNPDNRFRLLREVDGPAARGPEGDPCYARPR